MWPDDTSCEFQENFSSWFESELSKDFKISECRDLCWFLGKKIVKEESSIEINEEQYSEKLLETWTRKLEISRNTTCRSKTKKRRMPSGGE